MVSKTASSDLWAAWTSPLIRKFQCGYEQGVKATNPKAEVFSTDWHHLRCVE